MALINSSLFNTQLDIASFECAQQYFNTFLFLWHLQETWDDEFFIFKCLTTALS